MKLYISILPILFGVLGLGVPAAPAFGEAAPSVIWMHTQAISAEPNDIGDPDPISECQQACWDQLQRDLEEVQELLDRVPILEDRIAYWTGQVSYWRNSYMACMNDYGNGVLASELCQEDYDRFRQAANNRSAAVRALEDTIALAEQRRLEAISRWIDCELACEDDDPV
ncbi:MAG: hypothetical protein ED559_06300 [Phycisphaera sp.]|nr:MAG: hypothetical protein ED559_06300 [Phycisphaera sp.]